MKFGLADYGMNVWDGGCFDLETRLLELKKINFNGIERVTASTEADLLYQAALFHKHGMDFTTVRGPDVSTGIRWTAAMGKDYVWTQVNNNKSLDVFCRQVNKQVDLAAKWGVNVCLHNHLGSLVENQEQLDFFMKECPEAKLVFDTGHHAAADGNCLEVLDKYFDRIHILHLKDWKVTSPETGLDRWPERGHFCEVDGGNIGLDNFSVLSKAIEMGYDGWVFIEHDTHHREPVLDLEYSLTKLKQNCL